MEFNKYQTQITDELRETLVKDEYEILIDYISNVPFINNLIKPDREYAKNRPLDSLARIIVDITNPHILENMDYFRPSALHFKKYGCFTLLRPNSNPNSEFGKWLKEEINRIWYGMVRPSDGEWIPGDYYWYLNYCPILQAEAEKGKNKANRIEDFPKIYDGDYLYFHYIDQARNGGMYNDWKGGQHAAMIARRGCGKAHPYSLKLDTPNGIKTWEDLNVGDLVFGSDGKSQKITHIHEQGVIPIYEIKLKDGRKTFASLEHLWKVKHKGKEKIFSTKDIIKKGFVNHTKERCPSGIECLCSIPINKEVFFNKKEVMIDPYTLGVLLGDGSFRTNHKNKIYFTSQDNDIEVYKKNIPYQIQKKKNKYSYTIEKPNIKNDLAYYNLYNLKSEDKFIPYDYKYNTSEVRLNILQGLMDTDGFSDKNGHIEFYSKSKKLSEDVAWICRSLGIRCSLKTKNIIYKGKTVKNYRCSIITSKPIFRLDRKLKNIRNRNTIYLKNQENYVTITSVKYSHNEKAKCITVENSDSLYLVNDFITTHNSYKNGATLAKYFIVGENERACKEVKSLACASEKEYLIKDGILNKFVSFIDFCAEHTEFPRARLKDSLGDMIWKMGYKDVVLGINKGTENEVMGVTTKDNADKARGKRANKMIYEEFGKYSNFIQTWNTNRFNVEDGDYAFGQAVAFGTGGTENSDFSGALEMIYNPRGYGIYPLPNVFNKNSKGASTTIFFFGAFMNRTGYMDKDGNSDVIGAMISVLKSRSNVKYNSTDPLTLTQKIAEEPFTIDEAIMRRDGTLFPVSDLTDLLNEIKENQRDFLSSHYIGRLVQNSNGEIEWKPDADIQILRTYKIKDNRKEGGLEIFEMPKKNSSGSIYSNRYIISCDPIDDDGADTTSLFAFHILDLWTDRIVAEYAGRYSFAEDNYEELRKALLFYNARVLYENNKKGLFAWFSNRNSLYLLADVPQILKDVELMKGNLYGNRNKGYSGSVPSNAMGRRLLRDWLLKPIKELVTKKDENGNFYEEEVTFRNLKRLRGMATIEELIQWDPDGNYDRVSSLTALMLYREEMYKYIIQNETEREKVDSNYIGNDPFFDVFDPQKMNTKWMKFQNSHNSS